ncbi:NAD-dependent epimerase/dehydratase family protein [Tautonia plasticadhaerens]|uniref:NAD dependent epimerase/dehydratase family protein n=1 Tax=Tautonia plasticadhaerens TaxID=2527974 RepID=A0A518GW44_9BACT|nr:NAD(P)-dependent oxidoreductase [Tautonia plasticadhaerens]QDV32815.1 NAD dependent epimerase/dehydratase family protein [Tautonia plasticadhaerens]
MPCSHEPAEGHPRPNGHTSLPLINPDPESDDFGDKPTVLLTGACGGLGRKLRDAWAGRYDLILIDHRAGPDDPEVLSADLSEQDELWMGTFHGADAVVHLAANPHPNARWEDLVGPNLDATANVLHAAVLGAVDRVVFASSSHTMWGYRDDGDGPISEDLAPRPDGPYGASKLAGERLGRSFSLAFELAFVALRIGWVQPGENLAATLPDDWARSLWLSNRDLVQLVERALWAEVDEGFLVVNGMSRNRPGRWPIDRAVEALGYEPHDGEDPASP